MSAIAWKVVLSGYADHYGYELGLLDQSLQFEALSAGCPHFPQAHAETV